MILAEMVLMVLIPCLLGEGALRLLYQKQNRQDLTCGDSVLIGWLLVIGLAETAHLAAVFFGRSFSDCVKLFAAGLLLLTAVSAALLFASFYRRKRDRAYAKEAERLAIKRAMEANPHRTQERIIFLVFLVLALIQLALLETGGKIYPVGDMTAETVNTMLATDLVYQANPMTGQPFAAGMPLRLRILCLPTLYAILCRLFSQSAAVLVWNVAPVMVLIGSYLAFYAAAKAFFPKDGRKRGVFMIITALLLWAGNYYYGMDGFAMQYAGYRGVSVRALILLPFTFSLILRKKWRLLPFCILAEACIVWTLYGLGACFFVTAGMLLLGILRDRIAVRRGGKEDDPCGN